MNQDDERPSHGVHRSATQGYSARASVYEAGRPDYPGEVLAWLRDTVGIGGGRFVLEVGAGAGAFTSGLTTTGARVCALEPVAAMRTRLAPRAPEAYVLGGTADALPVRAASMSAIVCAQSFHWFATRHVLDQFHRVLEPAGLLALVWNVRDERVPWVERLSALTNEYEGSTPRYRTGQWRKAFATDSFEEVASDEVAHVHVGAVDQVVVARTLSVSFVAALPEQERRRLEERLREFIAEEPALAGRASVSFPYRTTIFAYRPVSASRPRR